MLVNKKTDWDGFRTAIEERIQLMVPLQTEEQLDFEVNKFVNDIQQSAWDNTPEIKKRLKGNNYPSEILELISEKRQQRKKWHQTRAPQEKTRLNNLSYQLKEAIKQLKNDTVSNFLRDLTNDSSTDYSLWKTTKNLKRPIMQIPPIKKIDGSWARNNEQKAYRFAEHLEKAFQPHATDSNETLPEVIQQVSAEIPLTSPAEIKQEIKSKTNSIKAPGYDLITWQILKELPRKALVKLTNLINAAFRLKYVPQLWKVAEVILIPKPGKPPHEATSYRGFILYYTSIIVVQALRMIRHH
jgi:hypothetical protein